MKSKTELELWEKAYPQLFRNWKETKCRSSQLIPSSKVLVGILDLVDQPEHNWWNRKVKSLHRTKAVIYGKCSLILFFMESTSDIDHHHHSISFKYMNQKEENPFSVHLDNTTSSSSHVLARKCSNTWFDLFCQLQLALDV